MNLSTIFYEFFIISHFFSVWAVNAKLKANKLQYCNKNDNIVIVKSPFLLDIYRDNVV